MKVIINADDLGLCESVNVGILESIKNGVVTSTTILANSVSVEDAIKIAIDNNLDVGIHLALTIGKPVCDNHKTIVDNEGNFFNISDIDSKIQSFDIEEIRTEFLAQIKKIEELGIEITHIDSHHHVHGYEKVAKVVAQIAKERNFKVRPLESNIKILKEYEIKTPERFVAAFYQQNVSVDGLKNILEENKQYDTLEIMCHPSMLGDDINSISKYNEIRYKELEIMCSKEIKQYIENNDVQLIGYKQL